MIHTAALQFALEKGNIDVINKTRPIFHKMSHKDFGYGDNRGIVLTLVSRKFDTTLFDEDTYKERLYENKEWMAYLTIDFVELLNGKTDIRESDIPIIKTEIMNFLYPILGEVPDGLILRRIDYRYDALVQDKNQRALLINLYKKCLNMKQHMVKSTKYKTSICYNSGSRRNNIYDKLAEREANRVAPKSYEAGIIRYEAQLLKRHIVYNKKKKKGSIEQILENYISKDMYNKYMRKMIVGVVYLGDYYTINSARKIIQNASIIKDGEKELLIKFLINTSEKGMTKSKEMVSPYYFKKYLELLQQDSIYINPILIPKNHRSGIKEFKNPISNIFLD